MRTIKFRGKRQDNGEWVYGWLLEREIDTGDYYIREMNVHNDPPRYQDFRVAPETVGQFTGLSVIGGEVYVGDILRIGRHMDPSIEYKRTVVYWNEKDCAYYGLYPTISGWSQHKLIGNIHDNPELLR